MALSAWKTASTPRSKYRSPIPLEDLWKLVDTSESTRRHCIMLEECCYGYTETLVLNMVRRGMLGNSLWRGRLPARLAAKRCSPAKGEGLWRRAFHTLSDGNLYPTHGLGPVANYMSINRGDRFDYMVSMSTPARGLAAYREANTAKDDPKWKEKYIDRGFEYLPDQDSRRPDYHAQARYFQSSTLRPHQHDRRHQGRLYRLPAADLPRRASGWGRVGNTRLNTRRNTRVRCGPRKAPWPAPPEDMAAWTSS